MKLAGFLVGAVAAGVAVFAFNSWRHVSDDDRLTAALRDHCIPFVHSATQPFDGIGRAPGVYDDVDVNEAGQDGGVRLIYDHRFVAQWGVVIDTDENGTESPVRLCTIASHANSAGFAVAQDGFIDRYGDVLSDVKPLVTETAQLQGSAQTVLWNTPQMPPNVGYRALMIASDGAVISVTVIDEVSG
jgi:hypothetical protein